MLKFEKIQRKEKPILEVVKDQEDEIFDEELPSRLDTLDTDKTKKN